MQAHLKYYREPLWSFVLRACLRCCLQPVAQGEGRRGQWGTVLRHPESDWRLEEKASPESPPGQSSPPAPRAEQDPSLLSSPPVLSAWPLPRGWEALQSKGWCSLLQQLDKLECLVLPWFTQAAHWGDQSLFISGTRLGTDSCGSKEAGHGGSLTIAITPDPPKCQRSPPCLLGKQPFFYLAISNFYLTFSTS